MFIGFINGSGLNPIPHHFLLQLWNCQKTYYQILFPNLRRCHQIHHHGHPGLHRDHLYHDLHGIVAGCIERKIKLKSSILSQHTYPSVPGSKATTLWAIVGANRS